MFKIENENLVITIPLKQKRTNCYECSEENPEGYVGEMDNIVGIIDRYNIGFGYLIDMSYCGKADQNTGINFYWNDSENEFIEFCKKNNIQIIK